MLRNSTRINEERRDKDKRESCTLSGSFPNEVNELELFLVALQLRVLCLLDSYHIQLQMTNPGRTCSRCEARYG